MNPEKILLLCSLAYFEYQSRIDYLQLGGSVFF